MDDLPSLLVKVDCLDKGGIDVPHSAEVVHNHYLHRLQALNGSISIPFICQVLDCTIVIWNKVDAITSPYISDPS